MGDPAGIGPEVILAALAPASVRRGASCVLVGDAAWLQRAARRLGLPWPWRVVQAVDWGPDAPPCQLWDVVRVPAGVRLGRVQAAAGRVALAALDRAIALARTGPADALVTAPVSKAAISRTGRRWIGHTEYLGAACAVAHPVMMFVAGTLRVSLVTTHEALARAIRAITPARVARAVTLTAKALEGDLGIRRPRVAVVGMDFSYAPGTPMEKTQYAKELLELFGDRARDALIKVRNPYLGETWLTDPAYYWYRQMFLEMTAQADCVTYNCTEGGILFGKSVRWMSLRRFLAARPRVAARV